MKTYIFDIETAPLPESELDAMLPPFDPMEVKMGNLKDPDKIASKLAEASLNHRRDFIDRAALDPLTGRVLVIGVKPMYPDGDPIFLSGDESDMLEAFWNLVEGDAARVHQLIGFNTHLFDLPFLIRRSWKHAKKVPWGVRKGRYWGDQMIDLRNEWQLGDRQARGSLDAVAKHLGLGGKSGSGKDFANLWATDQDAAIKYLTKDLELTESVARRIWVSSNNT